MEYVIFKIAGEEFGVSIAQVREVVRLSQRSAPISPLPQAPDFIIGMMTHRQHSIAVMDIRKRLRMSGGQASEVPASGASQAPDYIMIVRVDRMILGLQVERVTQVAQIAESQIDKAADFINGHLEGRGILGVAHLGERTILILDLNGILDSRARGELEKLK